MTTYPTIAIREATLADIAALSVLATDTFTETFGHLYSAKDLAAHLRSKCSQDFFREAFTSGDMILVVTDGAQLIGYCKIGGIGLPVAYPPARAQEIHRIYIRKEYHGRGLGQTLLERVLQTNRLREASVIYLGVWEENDRAKQFYYRNGFLPVGRYLYYVGEQADKEMILAHTVMAQPVLQAIPA